MVREVYEIYMEFVVDFVGEGFLFDRIFEFVFLIGYCIFDFYFVVIV